MSAAFLWIKYTVTVSVRYIIQIIDSQAPIQQSSVPINNTPLRLVAVVATLLVIVLFLGVCLLAKNIFVYIQSTSVIQTDEVTFFEPGGVLYASMARPENPLGILSYNFSEANPSFKTGIAYDGATLMQFLSATEGTSFAVFSSVVPNQITQKRQSNILVTNESNQKVDFLLPENNTLTGIRNLDYSEKAYSLTFTAKDMSSSSTLSSTIESVDQWGVYISNIQTKVVEKIASGSDASWSPDGASLLFLGADGLKQYNVADKNIKSVAVSGATGTFALESNMNLDVSPDGTLMALSSPNDDVLSIFEIKSWSPLSIVATKKYPSIKKPASTFYWPTFSPDNSFIAVQIADMTQLGEQSNPRIVIIRLADMHFVREIPIADYDFTRAFIDSWTSQ